MSRRAIIIALLGAIAASAAHLAELLTNLTSF